MVVVKDQEMGFSVAWLLLAAETVPGRLPAYVMVEEPAVVLFDQRRLSRPYFED